MPTAIVNDHGSELFFEDTGAPLVQSASQTRTTPYTTLIIVHGTAFHGAVFHRLISSAPQHNLRLIFVNRREYPGSSPYDDEDLQNVSDPGDEKGYEAFFQARGREFGRLTEWILSHEGSDIPKADWENNAGGIFIMAWSSGNAYTIPILSDVDQLPEPTRNAIEPYFRGFIIFDAPRWLHGLPPTTNGPDHTFRDKSLTPAERARIFSRLVGGYYKHASLTSHNIDDLQKEAAHDSRQSTPEGMSKEELARCTDYKAVIRSELQPRSGPIEGYAGRVRRAAFDDELAKIWPRCRVHVVFCECSPSPMIETGWRFEQLKQKYAEQGVLGRKVTVEMMPNANHFPHWEEPEMTIAFFARVMASSGRA